MVGPMRFELTTTGSLRDKMYRWRSYKTGALTRLSYGPILRTKNKKSLFKVFGKLKYSNKLKTIYLYTIIYAL